MSEDQNEPVAETQEAAPEAAPGEKPKKGAKAKVKEAAPGEFVQMRVLKKGAGRISKGVHEGGVGDEFFSHGDLFYAPSESVDELEERGLAEAV